MLDMLVAAAEAAHHAEEHVEPAAFGIGLLTPGFFVALAMLIVIGIALFAGVPRIIAGVLDQRIAGIRKQLDEAKQLRAEAAALRDEYAAKAAAAEADIAALRERADRQADEIVEKAKADAAALIERHKALSADKIATAEREAVAELRATAAAAAAAAARELIAERHGEAEDRQLADRIIAEI